MSNSPLISYTALSECFGNFVDGVKTPGRAGEKIKKITVHHTAGISSVEGLGEVFRPLSRGGSSNYGIGNDGRIGMYVEEKNRAWTSSSAWNDNMAVTIEVSNCEVGGEWRVGESAMASLISLCTDICRRNGIERLNYTGDTSGNLTMHKWFAATACPGPYLESKFSYIANEVNKRLEENKKLNDSEKKEFEGMKKDLSSLKDTLKEMNKVLSSLESENKKLSERVSSISEDSRELSSTVKSMSLEVMPRWNTVEEVPSWGQSAVKSFAEDGALKGDGDSLAVSRLMLRLMVLMDRKANGAE